MNNNIKNEQLAQQITQKLDKIESELALSILSSIEVKGTLDRNDVLKRSDEILKLIEGDYN